VSVLDQLNTLSRKKWPWATVAGMIVLALLLNRCSGDGSKKDAATTTTNIFVGTGPNSSAPPSTGPTAEVDREGDPPNPGALDPKRTDIRPNDQERQYGYSQEPARLGGYSAWVEDHPTIVNEGPDKKAGKYLKIRVKLTNRANDPHPYKDTQWTLMREDGFTVATAFATQGWVNGGSQMVGNSTVEGELYFELAVSGRYYVLFRPSEESARGVWGLNINL
jgi:hypothetical protein